MSTAAQKLKASNYKYMEINCSHGYRILKFYTVFSATSQFVICKECKEQINFNELDTRVLGFKIKISCTYGMQ